MAFFLNYKKPIAASLILAIIVLLVLPAAFLVHPKKAKAQLPVSDVVSHALLGGLTFVSSAIAASTAATAAIKVKEEAEWWVDLGMRVLGEILLRQVLAMITNDIVAWINNGGKPRFVSDWAGFLKDAANSAAGAFVDEYLGLGWMCEPFDLDIKIALLPEPKFNEKVRCTITDIVDNIEDFYNDFSKGGWAAWIELTKPQNNMYGAYFMALDAKMGAAAEARDAAEKEALAGGGFLGVRDEFGRITTPGRLVSDLASKVVTQELDLLREQIADLTDTLGPYQIYVVAIANALVNKVIREGFSMLTGVGGEEKAVPGPNSEDYEKYLAGEIPELPPPAPGEPYPSSVSLPPSTIRHMAETDKLTAESIRGELGLLQENLVKLRNQQNLTSSVLENINQKQTEILRALQTNYVNGLPLPSWARVNETSPNFFEITATGVGKITLTKTSDTTYELGPATPEAYTSLGQLNSGQSDSLAGVGRNEIQNLIAAVENVRNNELVRFINACNEYMKYYEVAKPNFTDSETTRLKTLEQTRQDTLKLAISALKSALYSKHQTLTYLSYDALSGATDVNSQAILLERTRGLSSDEPGENTLYGQLAELDKKLLEI